MSARPRRDLTQAQFDRACAKYGITRTGEGQDARYTWPSAIGGSMPVKGLFRDQLPWRNRRTLLAELIRRVEEDARHISRTEAVRSAPEGTVVERYAGFRPDGRWVQGAIVEKGVGGGPRLHVRTATGRLVRWAAIECRIAKRPAFTLLDALRAHAHDLEKQLGAIREQIDDVSGGEAMVRAHRQKILDVLENVVTGIERIQGLTLAERYARLHAAAHGACMSAADVLGALCPRGEPIDGVTVEQDWDNEATRITLEDGSALVVSGNSVEVAS